MAERAIAELGGVRDLTVRGPRPGTGRRADAGAAAAAPAARRSPDYAVGDKVATRKAYGDALVRARRPPTRLSSHSTARSAIPPIASEFAHAYPERYFEMFIAEQQLVAAATGLNVRGYRAFASTFAAFFTRAYDFIRMGAISGVDLRLVGSHAGVEIGADGPVADGAGGPGDDARGARLDGALPGRRHQHRRARRDHGRHGRASATCAPPAAPTPCLTRQGRRFPVGGSKVLRSHRAGRVTLVGAGVTLHACLGAADALAADGHRTPASSTAIRSSRSTPPRSRRRRRPPAGASSSPKTITRKAVSAKRSPTRPGRGRAAEPDDRAPRRPGDARLRHRRRTARLGRHRRRAHRRGRPRAGRR